MALGLLGGSPRQGELHDLLARAGANVATATGMLVQLLRSWPDGGELRQALKDIEHEGDDLTQAVIHHLNTRGPAPFPASDAHELISEIDDVVDYVEEVADFLGLYHVEAATEQALELAGILDAVGAEIAAALAKLSTLPELRPHVVALDRLEDDGDRVVRGAIASLFEGGIDPMVVIRWKDVYERLEAAIDAGGHVGNTLEGLIVRDVEGR
jgi:uncharacterized protein Yka (UPF0111/DUF47 family)